MKGRRKHAQGTADLSHGRKGPQVTWAHQTLVYAQPRLRWLDWVILFLSPSSTVNLKNDTQNFPIIFIAFLTLKKTKPVSRSICKAVQKRSDG